MVDAVQRGGRDGAVGLQTDVALRAEEQQHVVAAYQGAKAKAKDVLVHQPGDAGAIL